MAEADHVREIEGMRPECLTLEERSDEAAAIAQKLLDEGSAGPQVPMLHRVLAMASLTQGDAEGGRTALHASLEAARVRGADHDVAFTLDVLTSACRMMIRSSRRSAESATPSSSAWGCWRQPAERAPGGKAFGAGREAAGPEGFTQLPSC